MGKRIPPPAPTPTPVATPDSRDMTISEPIKGVPMNTFL